MLDRLGPGRSTAAVDSAPRMAALPATKLAAPVPSVGLVPRPRLVELLDGAVRRPFTLVSAPAGSGKTALLAEWMAQGSAPGPVAWLSLGPEEADRRQFWSHAVAAAGRACPELAGARRAPARADRRVPRPRAQRAHPPGAAAGYGARRPAPGERERGARRPRPPAREPFRRPAPDRRHPQRPAAAPSAPAGGGHDGGDPGGRARLRARGGGGAPARPRPRARGPRAPVAPHRGLGHRAAPGRALARARARSARVHHELRRQQPGGERLLDGRGGGSPAGRAARLPDAHGDRAAGGRRPGRRAHRTHWRRLRAPRARGRGRLRERGRRRRRLVPLPPAVPGGSCGPRRAGASRTSCRSSTGWPAAGTPNAAIRPRRSGTRSTRATGRSPPSSWGNAGSCSWCADTARPCSSSCARSPTPWWTPRRSSRWPRPACCSRRATPGPPTSCSRAPPSWHPGSRRRARGASRSRPRRSTSTAPAWGATSTGR